VGVQKVSASLACVSLLLLSLFTQPIWARDCTVQADSFQSQVVRVSDGDTVVLNDERKVRLIGFNTWELTSENLRQKELAQRAKSQLESMVLNKAVILRMGKDPKDRYGRLLAHMELTNGQDVAQAMIQNGLAAAVAVGQNTRCAQSNMQLEMQARAANAGMWAQPDNVINSATRLTGRETGFHIMRARIERIAKRANKRYLVMSNGLHVRLGYRRSTKNMLENTEKGLSHLIDKTVEVRGWLGRSAGTLELTLHHPLNLQHAPEKRPGWPSWFRGWNH